MELVADARDCRHGTALASLSFYSVALLFLLAPALWNGYPLLQYDTGGYLARWYEGYLVPSRSTVFGLFLHLGEGWHFWPVVAAQSLLTIWIVSLTLRAHGVARSWRARSVVLVCLVVATALPWLTSTLFTDIFLGLGVLALHLVLFRREQLGRSETTGLLAVIAFASASHSATMATLIAVLMAGVAARIIVPAATPARSILYGLHAIALGAALLLTANFALSGKVQWTPGGYGILFGRMLQDGIVARYLTEHCAGEKYKLCPYRHELPQTADDFLWSYGVFNTLGRFEGLGEEMRTIVLRSLVAYPGEQIRTAITATAQQLTRAATGAGVHDAVWHTYGIIERYIPGEVATMRAARQQRGELTFDQINSLHVPVALLSMAMVLTGLYRFRKQATDDVALLAASIGVAILSNAFLCGALSGPHDRYGARISWVATFGVAILALRLAARMRVSPAVPPPAVAATP